MDGGEKKSKQNSDRETSQKEATLRREKAAGNGSRLIISDDRHGNGRLNIQVL